MNEHKSNQPLSSLEKLTNLYGSLADDVAAGYIDPDEQNDQDAAPASPEITDKELDSDVISDRSKKR